MGREEAGELCELIMGQSPDGNTYNTDGIGIPLITMSSLHDSG